MTDTNAADAVADGRPSAGAALAQSLTEEAARRPKSRDIKNLAPLLPFIRAHWRHAAAGVYQPPNLPAGRRPVPTTTRPYAPYEPQSEHRVSA